MSTLSVVPPLPPANRLGGHLEDMLTSLLVLASVVEARDPYTGGHLWRVAQFSRLLAEEAGLPRADIARVALGGFLHDLGKIAIPDAILHKPGPLTDPEYAVMKTHPEVGARLLSGHPLGALVRAAVLEHHERPDGRGYPYGLQDVSLDGRIVGIADAFDAMTSARPYRGPMPIDRALGVIEQNLGTQFDRALGAQFVALGRRGALDHVVGHSDDGIPLHSCPRCGPVIVARRGDGVGALVYCRPCGVRGVLGEEGPVPTALAEPRELEPQVDMELIEGLVRSTAPLLSAA